MGPVAIQLELSRTLCGLYPVFRVLLLCKHLPGGDEVELSAPVLVEYKAEYKVEAFIVHQ